MSCPPAVIDESGRYTEYVSDNLTPRTSLFAPPSLDTNVRALVTKPIRGGRHARLWTGTLTSPGDAAAVRAEPGEAALVAQLFDWYLPRRGPASHRYGHVDAGELITAQLPQVLVTHDARQRLPARHGLASASRRAAISVSAGVRTLTSTA